MKYPAPDGHIIESSPYGPVVYTCPSPLDWSNGTFESFETSSKYDNTLQQIKIIRVVNDGFVEITVTEQTQQEIQNYFQNLT